MMNRVKIFAIVLVILAGAVSSYLILKNPGKADVSGANAKISDLSNAVLDKNPIQWVEKAKQQIVDTASAISAQISGEQSSLKTANLTDMVASQMFSGMKDIAQNGVSDSQGNFNPDDPTNQKLLDQTINNIQDPLAGYDLSVDDKAIKTSQDNSKDAIIRYLIVVNKIAQGRMSGFNKSYQDVLSDISKNGDFSLATNFADTQKNIANDYLNLTVPSSWVDVHKQLIIHFKTSDAIFRSIGNYSNDPVRASLALQMVDQLENTTKENQAFLREKMKEFGL